MGQPIFIDPYNGKPQKKKVPTSATVLMVLSIINATVLSPAIIGYGFFAWVALMFVDPITAHVALVFLVAYGVLSITALITFIYNFVKGGICFKRSWIIIGISIISGILLGNLVWYVGPYVLSIF